MSACIIELQVESAPGGWWCVNQRKAAPDQLRVELLIELERMKHEWLRAGVFGDARMRVQLR